MATSYIDLVNKLRDRFNEVHLTAATWNTVVGFDQYCKDAINYAYHDILNAEMEWPFCHRDGTILTQVGTILYNVSTADEYTIKEIDWDSFYIDLNRITASVTNEAHTIPATSPYSVTPTSSDWGLDAGVRYASSGIDFQAVDYDPQTTGQYTIKDGVYYFNSGDANTAIVLNYATGANSTINVNSAVFLPCINYDEWRQIRMATDWNAVNPSGYGQPRNVFKTQRQGEIGITPTPNKIYSLKFEYWVDADDMVNTTDTTLLPTRYEQVLLDGAAKYCYEFREDTPLAKNANDRFTMGVARMRTELINRNFDMRSGFCWRNSSPGQYTFFNS